MLVSSFFYYYYKNSSLGDIYKSCQISASGLKLDNKEASSKKKDLVRLSSRRSTILSNGRPGVILINTSQLKLINGVF